MKQINIFRYLRPVLSVIRSARRAAPSGGSKRIWERVNARFVQKRHSHAVRPLIR